MSLFSDLLDLFRKKPKPTPQAPPPPQPDDTGKGLGIGTLTDLVKRALRAGIAVHKAGQDGFTLADAFSTGPAVIALGKSLSSLKDATAELGDLSPHESQQLAAALSEDLDALPGDLTPFIARESLDFLQSLHRFATVISHAVKGEPPPGIPARMPTHEGTAPYPSAA